MNPAPKDLLNFSEKAVIVTGASQGIGAGIALRFAQAGAKVIVHYRNNEEGAQQTVEKIINNGGKAIAAQAELSNKQACDTLITQAVLSFGSVDVLINNAGSFPNAALMELTLEQWQSMYQSNVETAFLCLQAAARQMIQTHTAGAIVNLASIAALSPGSDHSHYNSAKAAVVMMTQSAAQELGTHNIRVNAVSPGLISRPGIEEQWPEGVKRWQHKAPLSRMGTSQDIADACLFLSSNAAQWITGHNLVVDGGVMSSAIY